MAKSTCSDTDIYIYPYVYTLKIWHTQVASLTTACSKGAACPYQRKVQVHSATLAVSLGAGAGVMPIHSFIDPFHSMPFHSLFHSSNCTFTKRISDWPSTCFKSHKPFHWEHVSHWQSSESGTTEKRNREARCQANHRCAASRSAREASKQYSKDLKGWGGWGSRGNQDQRQCKPKREHLIPRSWWQVPYILVKPNEPYLRRSTHAKPFLIASKLPTSASSNSRSVAGVAVEVINGYVTTFF